MVTKKTKEFASTISFTVKEDSAFGFIENFLISVYETGTKKTFFVYYYLDTDVKDENDNPVSIMSLSNVLMDVFSKFGITEYSHKEYGLEVTCSLSYKQFYSLIKETVKKLSKISAVKKNICSECLAAISDSETRYRLSKENINYILCSQCGENAPGEETTDEDFDEDLEENKSNEHYNEENEFNENFEEEASKKPSKAKGILGSILFSIGISICLILLYAFVIPLPSSDNAIKPGYYVNWLYAPLALASFWGYKLFSHETMGNKQLITTGIISVVTSLLCQYISTLILFARESILTFENLSSDRFAKMIPSLLKIPFTDNFVSPDFKIYVLMDLIFIVISLLVISFLISPKANSEIVIEKL